MDKPSLEYCALRSREDGWELEGNVVLALDASPMRVHYRVSCDKSWKTRATNIELYAGTRERNLLIIVDDQQRWWAAGKELLSLRGCLDVDLSITPATNTLPVRRLGLSVGNGAQITAAWVRFPSLSIEPLTQSYTRLGDNRYRYESVGGTYATELSVDDLGLIIDYAGRWQREATMNKHTSDPLGENDKMITE